MLSLLLSSLSYLKHGDGRFDLCPYVAYHAQGHELPFFWGTNAVEVNMGTKRTTLFWEEVT